MPSVSSRRSTAAARGARSSNAKKEQFDLSKKATVRGLQIKSGDGFTVKLPPGKWKLDGLNGSELFEFKAPGQKRFLPLEQFSDIVNSGIELRAKGPQGWNSLGQLTFTNEKGKVLFLEMHVDGGKAPKNQPISLENNRPAVGGISSGYPGWSPSKGKGAGGSGS